MTKDKIVKILDDYAKGVINKKSLNIFADNLISSLEVLIQLPSFN